LADGTGRETETVALALEVPRLFQLLRDLAETLQIARGLGAEQPLHRGGIDLVDVLRILRAADLLLELLHLLEVLHEPHRLPHLELVVTAEPVLTDHLVERKRLAQLRAELAHLGLEALVLPEERA